MDAERRALVHEKIVVRMQDGDDCQLLPGPCVLREDGTAVTVEQHGDRGDIKVRVPGSVLNRWLQEHQMGFLGW